MKYAPIVLFAYARPEHTLRTLKALADNTLAADSRLYIYIDGPQVNAGEVAKQRNAEVRRIAHSKRWCGEVEIIEQPQNKKIQQNTKMYLIQI